MTTTASREAKRKGEVSARTGTLRGKFSQCGLMFWKRAENEN